MSTPATFLPDTLNGWLSFIVQLCTAVGIAVGIAVRTVRKPLQDQSARDREQNTEKFKAQGERLGLVEGSIHMQGARIESQERASERLHLQATSIAEQFGRHDARLERFMGMLEEQERERLAEDRSIGERLARIETRLDVQDDMKKILGRSRDGHV